MDDKHGLLVGDEVTKTEVFSVEATYGGFMTLVTITEADMTRMHQDRLEELFGGLEAIGNAIGAPEKPTAKGEARRAFEKQMALGRI